MRRVVLEVIKTLYKKMTNIMIKIAIAMFPAGTMDLFIKENTSMERNMARALTAMHVDANIVDNYLMIRGTVLALYAT